MMQDAELEPNTIGVPKLGVRGSKVSVGEDGKEEVQADEKSDGVYKKGDGMDIEPSASAVPENKGELSAVEGMPAPADEVAGINQPNFAEAEESTQEFNINASGVELSTTILDDKIPARKSTAHDDGSRHQSQSRNSGGGVEGKQRKHVSGEFSDVQAPNGWDVMNESNRKVKIEETKDFNVAKDTGDEDDAVSIKHLFGFTSDGEVLGAPSTEAQSGVGGNKLQEEFILTNRLPKEWIVGCGEKQGNAGESFAIQLSPQNSVINLRDYRPVNFKFSNVTTDNWRVEGSVQAYRGSTAPTMSAAPSRYTFQSQTVVSKYAKSRSRLSSMASLRSLGNYVTSKFDQSEDPVWLRGRHFDHASDPDKKHFITIINTLNYDTKVMEATQSTPLKDILDRYRSYNANIDNYRWTDIYENRLNFDLTLHENGLVDNSYLTDEIGLDYYPTILLFFNDGFENDPPMQLDIRKAFIRDPDILCRNYQLGLLPEPRLGLTTVQERECKTGSELALMTESQRNNAVARCAETGLATGEDEDLGGSDGASSNILAFQGTHSGEDLDLSNFPTAQSGVENRIKYKNGSGGSRLSQQNNRVDLDNENGSVTGDMVSEETSLSQASLVNVADAEGNKEDSEQIATTSASVEKSPEMSIKVETAVSRSKSVSVVDMTAEDIAAVPVSATVTREASFMIQSGAQSEAKGSQVEVSAPAAD